MEGDEIKLTRAQRQALEWLSRGTGALKSITNPQMKVLHRYGLVDHRFERTSHSWIITIYGRNWLRSHA